MSRSEDPVTAFYMQHLNGSCNDKGILTAVCPFCEKKNSQDPGTLVVVLQPGNFFHGYFRCLSRCVAGGFPSWFAVLQGIDSALVPGSDPEPDSSRQPADFPVVNINDEMRNCHDRLTDDIIARFQLSGVRRDVLRELNIGFNGRYITYPYIQADGNCYSLRCVFPDRAEDYFWQGDERFSVDPYRLFNVQELEHCAGGALFLCEGEDNLLALKQLGYPGVAVPHYTVLEALETKQFEHVRTLFLVISKSAEAESAAFEFASRVGYKVRLLSWPPNTPRHYRITDLARDAGSGFRQAIGKMIRSSSAFSPFTEADREYSRFRQTLNSMSSSEYLEMETGFPLLDKALDGMHGLNVIGGAPKVGKSAFAIQVASQMAERGIPVLYYDFENGRQQMYQRILCRITRIELSKLASGDFTAEEQKRFDDGCKALRKMLNNFRVVNDRKVTPELMRKHIDFIRHETRSRFTVVVVDSLHKLPFKDLSERRTGIDAWLRELEAIRDELQVSFLVISELSRGAEKAYTERPHLGVFKGSGDIEYSADNAMVLFDTSGELLVEPSTRTSTLWVVASREHSPGPVASYRIDYPYWGFIEESLNT